MAFPRELIWLTGAPGAGKGTHIKTILQERDLAHTVEVSSLLTGPAFEAIKASGRLVSDADVVLAVLQVLLEPSYAQGVVLDGFPRTAAQAAAIVLLAERLEERCVRFAAHPSAELRARTRKPRFTLATLWCDEEQSVKRQMSRGAGLARAHSIAAAVGISDASTPQARSTDLDEARARTRYAAFNAEVAACLAITKGHVRAVFIDASGAAEEVSGRVRKAFSYSAALDLDAAVYDQLRPIKSASNLVKCARSALVARLGRYGQESPDLLARVVGVLRQEFLHIFEQQALMGAAVVRSQNALLLGDRTALVMALDVLAERGYHVVLDVQLTHIPHSISGVRGACFGAAPRKPRPWYDAPPPPFSPSLITSRTRLSARRKRCCSSTCRGRAPRCATAASRRRGPPICFFGARGPRRRPAARGGGFFEGNTTKQYTYLDGISMAPASISSQTSLGHLPSTVQPTLCAVPSTSFTVPTKSRAMLFARIVRATSIIAFSVTLPLCLTPLGPFFRSRSGSLSALITSADAVGTTSTVATRLITVSFTVIFMPFQPRVAFWMSSPTFLGDCLKRRGGSGGRGGWITEWGGGGGGARKSRAARHTHETHGTDFGGKGGRGANLAAHATQRDGLNLAGDGRCLEGRRGRTKSRGESEGDEKKAARGEGAAAPEDDTSGHTA